MLTNFWFWDMISELLMKQKRHGQPARQGSERPSQSNIWQLNRNATLNIFLRFSGAQVRMNRIRGARTPETGQTKLYRAERPLWAKQPLAAADCAAGRLLRIAQLNDLKYFQNEPNQANYGADLDVNVWTVSGTELEFQRLAKRGSYSYFEREREITVINMRVWSWLRMNAGGVPNTCKSNGVKWNFRMELNLVADGWVTRG